MPKPKLKPHKKKQKLIKRTIGGYSSLKYVAMLVVGIGFVGTAAAITIWQPTAPITNPLTSLSHTADAPDTNDILSQINQNRTANNLTEVTLDKSLTTVAELRLKDMIDHQYYAHQSLNGQYYYGLFGKHGISAAFSCENLDIGTSLEAKDYIADWLMSNEGHKECLQNKRVSKVGMASGKFSEAQNGLTSSSYMVVTIFVEPTK